MLLITNLLIYANTKDKYLVLLGSFIGIVIHFILQFTVKQFDAVWIQAIVSLFCTKIGFDMIKGNYDIFSRLILVLLPTCFMTYYKVFFFLKKKLFLPWDNKFYTLCISQFDSFTTTATILSCVIYYATVTYLLVAPIQKCCYSFILYLTAAISLSQVFGYLELNFNQTPFSGMGDSLLT